MKNLVILAFLLIPSVSFAAPLTNDQATSLIAVVQSSTTTPASAFVSLITAFSSITEFQATTLIEVVQAAPGVPANAFVNMLIAFTVDAPTTNPNLGSTQPVVPTLQETTSAPVVESPAVEQPKKITAKLEAWGQASVLQDGTPIRDIVISLKDGGAPVESTITISASDGYFAVKGNPKLEYSFQNSSTGLNVVTYIPETKGFRDITLTAMGLTKIVSVSGDHRK